MNVAAASSLFSPQSVIRLPGPQADTNARQQADNQPTARQHERVVQGEVLARSTPQPAELTQDNLYQRRQANTPQQQLARDSRQAINTYIFNQAQGERIDQDSDQQGLIDVYV